MKGMKRLFQVLLFAGLALVLVQLSGSTAKADDKSYGIPNEIEGQWEYVGSGKDITDPESGRTWIWGNAYQKDGHNVIDTNQESYRKANEAVKKNNYMKDVKIVILYLPNCPYSKMYLPIFQQLAGNANAKVMLIDVMKYRTGSLRPYYDAGSIGLTSPGVLYVKPDGKLGGKSAVHSGEEFADILQEAGYTRPQVSEGQSTYTTEQEYKDDVLSETNRQRIAHGLLPLSSTTKLQDVADLRAKEIVNKMSHERPDGTMYVSALQEAGISGPNLFGENLAAGPTVSTPKAVVNAWMNSPTHRANILNGNYTHMGVGYYNNEKLAGLKYKDNWVQIFSGTCKYDKITLSQSSINVAKGVPIDDMDITVTLHCSTHGDSTMPLISEMTTGYDPNKSGEQRVIVHYGDQTVPLDVTVGTTEPIEITDSMVKLDKTTVDYNGKAQTPKVTVSNPNGDYALMEGYSYEYSYENNVNAGTAKVTVTGKGNYKGTVTKEFTIKKQDISKAKINGLEKSYEYTGKQITPVPTSVTLDGNTLYAGKDYDIEYGENTGKRVTNPGSPETVEGNVEVTIKGKGNYEGQVSKKDITIDFDDVQRKASQLNLYFNLKDGIYNSFVALRDRALNNDKVAKNYLEIRIPEIKSALEEANKSLSDDASDGITKLLNCESFPAVQTGIQEFYRYINEYGTDVKGTGKKDNITVEKPSVDSSAIKGSEVEVSGVENNISANQTAQLEVKDTAKEDAPKLNEEKYDTVSAVALDIDLNVNGKPVSQGDDKLTTPITITVPVPDSLTDAEDLVVLHYANGNDKAPEVLPVTKTGDKISFTTSSFSTFVITKKLPEYVAPVVEEDKGVDFGESTENTKIQPLQAPTDMKAVRSSDRAIDVSWKKVDSNDTWKTTGYLVTYSTNEDMSNAKTVEVDGADKTSTTIKGLSTGDYYVKVATVASSDFNPAGQAETTQTRVNIPVIVEDGKKVYMVSLPDSITGGKVTPVDNSKVTNVEKGTKVELNVTPDKGYEIEKVSITDKATGKEITPVTSENGKYTFTMPEGDVNVQASFKKVNYKVNVSNGIANGKLTVVQTAQVDDKVTITATPNEGYQLTAIKVTVPGENSREFNPTESNGLYTFTMPASDVTISAEFSNKPYTVSIGKLEHGNITFDESNIVANALVKLNVTPEKGYKLDSLVVTKENGEKVDVTDNTFVMPTSNVTITATFVKADYSITVKPTTNGTVTVNEDKKTAQLGDKITVTTKANEGYVLSNLNVTDKEGHAIDRANIQDKGNGVYEITMPASDINIEAIFALKKYTITADGVANGALVFDKQNVDKDQTVTVTVKPNSGYEFVEGSLKVTTVDGQEVTVTKKEDGTYTFTMPASDVKVTAEFKELPKEDHQISASTSNGSVQFDKNQAQVGEKVQATVKAASGYKLSRMRILDANGQEISLASLNWTDLGNGVYSFIMPEGAIKFVPEFVKEEVSKPAQNPTINEGKTPAQRPSSSYSLNERKNTTNPVTTNAVATIKSAQGTQDATAVTDETQAQEAKETSKKKVKKEKSETEVKAASEKKTESASGKSEKSAQHGTAIMATSAVVAVAAIGFGIWKFKIK